MFLMPVTFSRCFTPGSCLLHPWEPATTTLKASITCQVWFIAPDFEIPVSLWLRWTRSTFLCSRFVSTSRDTVDIHMFHIFQTQTILKQFSNNSQTTLKQLSNNSQTTLKQSSLPRLLVILLQKKSASIRKALFFIRVCSILLNSCSCIPPELASPEIISCILPVKVLLGIRRIHQFFISRIRKTERISVMTRIV